MKRIIVIGCLGSGKSTFARALQRKTGLPLHHLDLLFWNSDKTFVPSDVFSSRIHAILKQDCWILDGNYASSLEVRLQACDTVFFLDYSLETCLEGVAKRQGKRRADLPWVENEDDCHEMIAYVQSFHQKDRKIVIRLLEKYAPANQYIFHSHQDASEYLDSLPSPPSTY